MDNHDMSPREALYTIILELGPIPRTNRDDNITPKEARIRDAIRVLQDQIKPESLEDPSPSK
jgi:hypothetical protein